MRWFRLVSYTLFYWTCALLLVGFIALLHGDCWADGSKVQIAQCANDKRLLIVVGLVLSIVPYAFVARRALRFTR